MARSSSGYIKGAMGIVLIIVISMVINKISKKADIQDYGKYKQGIDNNKKLSPFSEQQKDSVSETLAGFWQNDTDAKDSATPGINDRIEIKKNGIIWRVKTYKYITAEKDTARFIHALTAYLRPFACRIDNPLHFTFDTHIIRQSYAGKDTCYGIGDVDTTWEILHTEKGLLIDNKLYTPYDTTDLKHFFPEGAVAMVDAVTVNPCNSEYLSKDYRELALQPSITSQKTEAK